MAIVSHVGKVGSGAEHSLLQFLERLPANIVPEFFFFEEGAFAEAMRERFGSVTIVQMSDRVAGAKRSPLPICAIPDSVSLAWRLANALRASAPDVVLTNTMKAHIVGSLAAKLAGVPCVNYVHDIVSGTARVLLNVVSRTCAVERLTCSRAVSASLGIDRCTSVYAPIETAKYRDLPERSEARAALGLPDDTLPVVALVGRIARWKGQHRFIRIAADVLRRADAHFVIVGSPIFGCDPAYMPELANAVAGAGLHGRVHFVPWQEDMRNVYAAIDLACNTSTREPFGRTSLEALASGVPIVCFDDAGICEIFAQDAGGTRVPAGDEISFAHVVHAYLTNPQRLAAARLTAESVARPLDIANVYASFADVIQRVANRATPRARSHSIPTPQPLPGIPQ